MINQSSATGVRLGSPKRVTDWESISSRICHYASSPRAAVIPSDGRRSKFSSKRHTVCVFHEKYPKCIAQPGFHGVRESNMVLKRVNPAAGGVEAEIPRGQDSIPYKGT